MKNYNRIGKNYDATRRADSYLVNCLARHLAVKANGVYLDAACGTGNYTLALAEEKGGMWHAVDCSEQMIDTARGKRGAVRWHLADVSALPFPGKIFDGAICTLAIHHFESLPACFSEIRRVLKPQGVFVCFTATPKQTEGYWLAEYFPKAIEKSAAALPGPETISDALHMAGFDSIEIEPYIIREDLQDLFLYSGKFKPEIYLDAKVRANISTFVLLADEREIETGCERLAADIAGGKIRRVIEQHRNSDDYLFVIAKAG